MLHTNRTRVTYVGDWLGGEASQLLRLDEVLHGPTAAGDGGFWGGGNRSGGGRWVSLIKSAESALMGSGSSALRRYVLGASAAVVQDETGLPATAFHRGH